MTLRQKELRQLIRKMSFARTIGKPVVFRPTDARKIQIAAMLRGVCLPILAIRSAIEN